MEPLNCEQVTGTLLSVFPRMVDTVGLFNTKGLSMMLTMLLAR